jgi:hypothetical protein
MYLCIKVGWQRWTMLWTMEFNLELLKTMWCFIKHQSMTKIISFLNLNKGGDSVFLILEHCFLNFFACRTPLVSKDNYGTSHPFSHKYGVARWQTPKIKNLNPMTDAREILIYISNVSNNLLHDLTLIKIIFSQFVGTCGFLVRYSKGHTK